MVSLNTQRDSHKQGFAEYKRQRRMSAAVIIMIIAAVTIFNLQNRSSISVQINDEMLGVAGPTQTVFIELADISDVSEIENFDFEKIQGSFSESDDVIEGEYTLDDIGEFTGIIRNNAGLVIEIEYSEGVFVFSGKSDKDTENLYQDLIAKIKE